MIFTASQIAAIVFLLQAFGVSPAIVVQVEADLTPATPQAAQATSQPAQQFQLTSQGAISTTFVSSTTVVSNGPTSIKIFNSGSYLDGMNAEHFVAPDGTVADTASDGEFVSLGATVYNADGSVNCSSIVTTLTSDATQNQSWFNTPYRDQNGNCYYQYWYVFKFAGTHTVEFDAGSAKQSVTMTAQDGGVMGGGFGGVTFFQ